MHKILILFTTLLFLNNLIFAQTPSDKPCDAPTILVSDSAGFLIKNTVPLCCNNYSNFLKQSSSCVFTQSDRDSWLKIGKMTAGQRYNFMFIETGNRQTVVEIFELPANKDCAVPSNFISLSCARANNSGFYAGVSISATFTPKNANSSYYARFQRANTTDEALEGTFSIIKSYPNEEPCTATPLVVQAKKGTKPTFGNNFTAADWKPEILTGPTCGSNNDVWYKFVATSCAMEIFIDNLSQTSFEMQAALMTDFEGKCNEQIEVLPCEGSPDQYLDITLSSELLTIGKTYYVIVDGYAPPYINGVGKFSIEVYKKAIQPDCGKLSNTTDIEKKQIKVFPNPSEDLLNIHVEQNLKRLYIIDFTGRPLKNISINSNESKYQISTLDLVNGFYFVQGVSEDGKKITQRFVVQH